jgi:competence protein ComEA
MNSKERAVLIFLIAVLLAGVGVNSYKRIRQQRNLKPIMVLPASDSTSLPNSSTPQLPNSPTPQLCLLDLNAASAAELDLLPGVGPVTAQRIIDYRTQNHGFRTKEDLLKVSGIGPKKYAAIKDRVKVQ